MQSSMRVRFAVTVRLATENRCSEAADVAGKHNRRVNSLGLAAAVVLVDKHFQGIAASTSAANARGVRVCQ